MSTLERVIDSPTLAARVEELGGEIAADYTGREPVVLGVLKGSVPFLADLSRHLPPEVEIDFLSLHRFGTKGQVGISVDSGTSLAGRDVLVVEDIVDTGLTLAYLLDLLGTRQPTSLATVTLVDKRPRRITEVPLEYRGFEVGDEFLLGYGLDWEGRYRNLDSIWAVLDIPAFAENPDLLAHEVFEGAPDRLGA